MANFFKGVEAALKQPLDEGQFLWDVLRGKTSLKDAPGEHQEMMNKVTVPILGNNKLAKNSDAAAGAIVGGIFAAPAIGGMMGGAGGISGATSAGGVSQGLSSAASGALGSGLGYGAGAAGAMGSTSAGALGGITASSAMPTAAAAGGGWMSTLGDMFNTGNGWLDQGSDIYNTLQSYDQMFGGGQQQAPSAPAFRPSFQQQKVNSFSDQVASQMGQTGQLSLDPYGSNKRKYILED